MVSTLVSGLSGLCLSPSWGHCVHVVFLGKTHSAFLHSVVQMGTSEVNAGSSPVMDLHPIQRE